MESGLTRLIYLNLSEALARMIVLRLWCLKAETRRRVRFGELVREVTAPLSLLSAGRFCTRVREDDAFVYFQMRGVEGEYHYPKALPLTDLAFVAVESFRQTGWHY